MNTKLQRHFVSMEAIVEQNVPTTLSKEATEEIAPFLNLIVADLFSLYIKIKGFHWHIAGAGFVQNHELLDKYAGDVIDMIDVFAERVRKIGANTLSSINQVSELESLERNEDPNLPAVRIFQQLIADFSYLIGKMRKLREICDRHSDTATSAIIDTFIDDAEKRVWFLNQQSAA